MSYSSGGGGGSISTASDTALSNPGTGQVLTYNATLQKWQNAAAPGQTAATTSAAGAIQLAGDLAGTSTVPQVTATHLAAALPLAQGGTGSTTQNFVDLTTTQSIAGAKTFSGSITVPAPSATGHAATKSYVDTQISGVTSSGAPDATTTSKGIVQLAGDLAGTAAAPTLGSTTNVNSIITNNTTVAGHTTAIAAKAAKGANSDITSLTGLTTALSITQGGTGATSASAALTALGALPAAQKAAASGVASLDTNTLVPRAQLGTGTASSSTVLYGDGVWRTASGASTQYTWTATKTSAYTVANGDAVICDATSGGFTVTLPTNLGANAFVRVKKIDSTVNAIVVSSTASIDGSASFSINNQFASQDFSYTGTTWYAV